MTVAVFGYGSLASAPSLGNTLGRPFEGLIRAELSGWRRRWSLARDNLHSEKCFALADGRIPPFVLGLNLEPHEDHAGPVNGVVIELSPEELERLDLREMRYDRIEVSDRIAVASSEPVSFCERIYTYVAKAAHFAPTPPPDSVILATYAAAVERAFDLLGPDEVQRFRATTGPYPAPVVEGRLVEDQIPAGNPRQW